MQSAAIDLHDVAKRYRRVQALAGVAMQVLPGEVFGLLGPNGAGKSTLVKILMTVIRPTQAKGTLLGRPIGHKPTLARVGYLPEHLRFPPYLTGRQALEFFAALSKVDRRTRRRRARELLDWVGMTAAADRKLGTYSKGMLQRIGLAQALVNDPELVVLDEPTDGLDPVGRREIREILLRLRQQQKTVFVNSHLLSEVERVCDRVAILVAGRIRRQGTIDELTSGSESFEIALFDADHKPLTDAIRTALSSELSEPFSVAGPPAQGQLASGEKVELSGSTVRVITGDPARIQPLIDRLRAGGLVIHSVRPLRQSLEDFFIQLVADDRPTGSAAAQQGGRS